MISSTVSASIQERRFEAAFFLETRRRPKSIAGSYNPRHPKPLLGWELRSSHEALASSAPVLMGRGRPDVVGYLTLCGLPVPAHTEAAAKIHPYNKRVFLAPYWDDIYALDAERKQDRKEAEAVG